MTDFNYKRLTGHIVTREDFEYEESRKMWNRAIEKYPLVIVYCYNEDDIRNAISFAKHNKLNVRIRSGRHHYEGYSNGNDDIVIDVSRMNKIYIDEENKLISIEAGVRNRELYEVTGKKGYPFPGGGCPTVGVVGFTLGGGWGYSARYLGLGCDSLVEAKVMNFKGEILVCNESCNEELFWALRGCGGGNFGIVTSMTFKLPKKVEMVTLIEIDFPNIDINECESLIKAWQEKYNGLDNRINFKLALYNSKEKGLGVKIIGLLYGSKSEANELLKPIKDIVSSGVYSLRYMSVLEANREIQDSHPEYEKYKSTGRFVYRDYSDEEILNLIKIVQSMPDNSTYTAITFYGLGGAVKNIGKNDTAFYHRNAKFILGFQSVWEEQKYAPVNREWLLENLQYIKTITEGSFVNFPCAELDSYGEEYYGENAKILTRIKEKYDIVDFFNFEQDIRIENKLNYNFVVK